MSDAILPEGESMRRAVRWISERLKEQPDQALMPLINEATMQYDLSPVEAEQLLMFYRRKDSVSAHREHAED
ncbi:MAG: hypothetical protein D6761_07810 [Candidatus Dadabacteria bacterium]|nr:MAG: hypothetical protein D6761_07810 [Candidatus Dadabacteria bacterium]